VVVVFELKNVPLPFLARAGGGDHSPFDGRWEKNTLRPLSLTLPMPRIDK
jgi:hypothetical protein